MPPRSKTRRADQEDPSLSAHAPRWYSETARCASGILIKRIFRPNGLSPPTPTRGFPYFFGLTVVALSAGLAAAPAEVISVAVYSTRVPLKKHRYCALSPA
jgi:hypothetical protein